MTSALRTILRRLATPALALAALIAVPTACDTLRNPLEEERTTALHGIRQLVCHGLVATAHDGVGASVELERDPFRFGCSHDGLDCLDRLCEWLEAVLDVGANNTDLYRTADGLACIVEAGVQVSCHG